MTLVRKILVTTEGRDSLVLLASRVLQMANGFALSVLLIRMFGLDAVGTYTVAAVAIGALSQIASAGLHYSLPREHHLSNPERNFIALCWAAGLLVPICVIVFVYGELMGRVPGEWLAIALFALGGYFFGQTNVLSTLLLLSHKTRWSILPPVMNLIGMLAAALVADTVVAFATVLLIFRALGTGLLFTRLDYTWVPPVATLTYGANGLKYSPMDLIAVLSEQVGPLIMAHSLTRAELGLFGLCQQLLVAGDTPGSSVIQAHYPALAKRKQGVAQSLRHTLMRVSVLTAVVISITSFVLGEYFYKLASFFPIMVVLTISLPWRYLNNFYDQILRAAGRFRVGTGLAIIKLLLSGSIFAPLVFFWGLHGGVFGLILLSLISSAMYSKVAKELC